MNRNVSNKQSNVDYEVNESGPKVTTLKEFKEYMKNDERCIEYRAMKKAAKKRFNRSKFYISSNNTLIKLIDRLIESFSIDDCYDDDQIDMVLVYLEIALEHYKKLCYSEYNDTDWAIHSDLEEIIYRLGRKVADMKSRYT